MNHPGRSLVNGHAHSIRHEALTALPTKLATLGPKKRCLSQGAPSTWSYAARLMTAVLLVVCSIFSLPGCGQNSGRTSDLSEMDPQAKLGISEAQKALGARQYLDGLALADSAIQNNPDLPEAHFLRGRILYEVGRVDDAVTAFESVLTLSPGFPGVHHNLGNAAFYQSRFRDALEHFSVEASEHPAARSWHAVGGTYWSLGVADSALLAYEKAESLDGNYAPGLASLSDWYESDGNFAIALEYASRALELEPENAAYLYKVGSLQIRERQYEKGIKTLAAVVAQEPWNHSAELGIGQALQALGEMDQGKEHIVKANKLREVQMGVDRTRRVAKRQADNFQVQLDYATALKRSNRLEEAIAQFEVARTLRPNNLGLRNNIATLHLQLDREGEALSRYRSIIDDDSTFAEAWLNLALYFGRKGDVARADSAMSRAVRFGQDNARVTEMVRRLRDDRPAN